MNTASTQSYSAERSAYTVREFCQRNGIARTTYYIMRKAGLGPREMRLGGTTVRISAEEEIAWQRARTNPGDAERTAAAEQAARLLARSRRATSGAGRAQEASR